MALYLFKCCDFPSQLCKNNEHRMIDSDEATCSDLKEFSALKFSIPVLFQLQNLDDSESPTSTTQHHHHHHGRRSFSDVNGDNYS